MADKRIDIVVTSKVRDALGGLGRVTKSVAKLGAVGAGIAGTGIAAMSVAAIKAASDYETLELRLEAVTGSASKASKIFQELRQFAASTPLRLDDITDARILLEGIGVSGQKALESVAGAAAALNRPIADVASTVASLETEPLRRMGIEVRRAGDVATFSFRDKFGRAITETTKGIENARQALLGIYSVKFGGFLQKASQSFNGVVSTFRDKLKDAAAQFGNTLLPTAKAFVSDLNEKLQRVINSGWLQDAGIKLVAAFETGKILINEAIENVRSGQISISDVFKTVIKGLIDAGAVVGKTIGDGLLTALSKSGLTGSEALARQLDKNLNQQIYDAIRAGKLDRSATDYIDISPNRSLEAVLFQSQAKRDLLKDLSIDGLMKKLSDIGSNATDRLGLSDPYTVYSDAVERLTPKMSRSKFGIFRKLYDNTGAVSGLSYTGRTTQGPSSIDRAVKGNYVLVRDQGAEKNTEVLREMLAALKGGVPAVAQ